MATAKSALGLTTTSDLNRIEAPVTIKGYLICAFAAFGGIFFGYDSGYINGVTGSAYFIRIIEGEGATKLTASHNSLIVSILSAGTFFGAIFAGDLADWYGRRSTIIGGCLLFSVGVALQVASHGLGLLVAGRLVAGLGVGFVTAIIILYMSEISPRKVRGAVTSGYQFFITVGILLASGVDYATQGRPNPSSYRIPIGIQFVWAAILAFGLFFLPESPRYFVKKGQLEKARNSLSRLRGQPESSEYIEFELSEIVANYEIEKALVPQGNYFQTWLNCFSGGLRRPNSNLRLTILGTSMQMMQQFTGINFIFYFSTPFLQTTGVIKNVFLISLIFNLVDTVCTPFSFYLMEKVGRRPLLIYGALGMLCCEFIVGIVGVTVGFNHTHQENGQAIANNVSAVNAQVAFIAIYIFFFATTWGPGAWVVIGEVFPLPSVSHKTQYKFDNRRIRSRGVALSTASNWLWNCILSVITPYLVNSDQANLRSSVFFLWGGLCTLCFIYAYVLIPETKGLSLEQVDQMMSETNPRNSAKWRPYQTSAVQAGILTQQSEKLDGEKEHVILIHTRPFRI